MEKSDEPEGIKMCSKLTTVEWMIVVGALGLAISIMVYAYCVASV